MPIYHANHPTAFAMSAQTAAATNHLLNQHAQQQLALAQHHNATTAAAVAASQAALVNPLATTLNYQPINFPLQYGQIISLPCKIFLFKLIKK